MPNRIVLRGARAGLATGAQLLVLLLGVVIPLIQLLVWAVPSFGELSADRMIELIGNTLILAALGATAVVAGGLVMLLAGYRAPRRVALWSELAASGYAIPGTVLAVALMLALTGFDRVFGTALAGGLLALIIAYLVRFVRAAWGPLEGVAARIRPELFDCARSLGASRFDRFLNVMLPLLRRLDHRVPAGHGRDRQGNAGHR